MAMTSNLCCWILSSCTTFSIKYHRLEFAFMRFSIAKNKMVSIYYSYGLIAVDCVVLNFLKWLSSLASESHPCKISLELWTISAMVIDCVLADAHQRQMHMHKSIDAQIIMYIYIYVYLSGIFGMYKYYWVGQRMNENPYIW